MHRKIQNPYIVDAYDLDMVDSAQLTNGWQKKYCMLAVVDHILWATFGVLLGRDITVMKKLHGDVYMNAPLWVCTYIS